MTSSGPACGCGPGSSGGPARGAGPGRSAVRESGGVRPRGAAHRRGCGRRKETWRRGTWGSRCRARGTARDPGTWPSELCAGAGGAPVVAAAGPVGCFEALGSSLSCAGEEFPVLPDLGGASFWYSSHPRPYPLCESIKRVRKVKSNRNVLYLI